MSEKLEYTTEWDLESIPDSIWNSEASRRSREKSKNKAGRKRNCGHPLRDPEGRLFFFDGCPTCMRARKSSDRRSPDYVKRKYVKRDEKEATSSNMSDTTASPDTEA